MKKMFLLSVLCFCVSLYSISPVYAQNTGESSSIQVDMPYECEEDLIEIMFDENSQVRLRNGSLVDFKSDALTGVDQILEQFDWHNWYRICDVPEDILDQWSVDGERNTGKPVYNMNNIYRLQIPKGYNIWELCKSLQNLPGIILAGPVPKPMALPIPGNYQSQQGYLNPASSTPTGIDAAYAWTQTGGTGTGVTVCDLEYSWNYNHADISKAVGSQINTLVQDPFSDNNHGTAVIGELVADNNSWGTTGICYGANLKTCGTYYGSPVAWNVPGAMAVAIASLSAGDIILLEQQWDYTGTNGFIPIEWWLNYSPNIQTNNGVYAAIVNAISNGIHVVEAGGNGYYNTDGLTWVGNSGAIIVGAGGAYIGGTWPNGDLQKLSFSSYGSRFDLQGWGENVVTTGYSDLYSADGTNYWYTSTFSGTSSASPIVAGALVCAEGYYLANVSATPPTPAYMRTHLKTYGTAQITPPAGNIGPRPNLYAAITNFPPPVQNYDWGDAPDPPHPTLAANNGAYHQIGPLFMGVSIDPEQNGQPTPNADGDDLDGNNDDDGVTFMGPLIPGTSVNVKVIASQGGFLNAWVDYNLMNTWADPGELIFNGQWLVPGVNNLSFTVPASAMPGPTYARFRFSSQQFIGFFAFVPDGEVEDYLVYIEEPQDMLDWGDAPDQPYPTLAASNGANHLLDGITFLGNQVDSEPDGQPDPLALGDDNDLIFPPPNDDEDGVTFLTPLVQNQMANIDVVASVPGVLNAWIDFAQDGSWAEVGDHIFIDAPLNPGINNLNIWIPAGAMPGQTYIRFRFDTFGGLNFDGPAPDGEVEDYEVFIEEGQVDEFDFGDAPEDALAYPSLGIVGSFPTCINVPTAGWIQHNTLDLYFNPGFDLENEGNAGLCPSFNPGQYNQDECFADGDAGLIVPDGFTITGPIGSETVQPCVGANNQHLGYTCQNAIWGIDIDIDVHNNMSNGNQAYFNVYIDWNQDGQWSGSSNCPGYAVPEHALVDFPISNPYDGPVSGLMAAGTTLPIGPNPGYVWARFTLTDVPVGSDWNGDGSFEDGETEDYLLLILEPQDEIDFGDASDPSYPTLLANNGANHIIDGITYMGASVDAEPDGQQTTNADGDDLDGNDDEDGVTFDWPLAVGNPCKITVNASVSNGLFSGWVDFDGNGSWADAGEQIFIDIPLVAGDNSLNFMIPTTTTAGLITYARFRFSTQPGLNFDGQAQDGEVEDYEVEIVEIGDYKWAQYPDTTLPGLHAHDYLNGGGGIEVITLADDWLCNGGLVTDIHWWGNYELDAANQEIKGLGINYFHLSIHTQSAAGCLPGTEVWSANVPFTSLTETYTGMNNNENSPIYLYEYVLNIPFDQEAGTKYWVDITASSNNIGQPAHWRWQESMRSYYPILCGAANKIDPAVLPWSTIQWLPNPPHKYSDMAFIITSEYLEPMDFGDAADPTYPTYLINDGARHLLDGITFMGTSVDSEYYGQADPNALGDDNDGNDDEDGVTFTTPLVQGQNASADIVVSVDGYLNAWLDFNANGLWGDPGEQIATDVSVLAGTHTLSFNVPLTATVGTTYSRFRFSTSSGLSYTGLASDGEVEDHEVTIEEVPNKWAQYPDTLLPGLHAHDYDSPPYGQIILADDWICDGGWVTDFHWWGNYEMSAGAELRGAGINHFHLSIHTNDPTNCLPQDPEIWGKDVQFLSLTELNTGLTNNEGCSIYLYEYILEEPFPQIEGEHYWLDITAVCNDPTDPARWRWQEAARDTTLIVCPAASKSLPTPGVWQWISWPNAYYSQMAFVITSGPAPDLDMGDADDPAYPTLLINNGAAHIIDGITFLGTSVDSETDGQPTADAKGDDNNGIPDDEDGVTVNPIFPVVPGGTIWYDIVASVSDTLNIWIDWNANGSWADAGEHAGVDISLSGGNNSILIPIPANAIVGNTYARFRFSSVGGLSYTGIAPDGEVEDHELTIEGDLDFGDAPDQALPAYPTLLASNGARHVIDPTIFLGNSIDLEPDGQPTGDAMGDDNDGNDDEDGVLIPVVLSHGSMNSITVIASANGYLNGWIDFNSSGDWAEADEHVLMDQNITAGTNTLNIAIPSTSAKGITFARFRFSTVPGLSYVGQAPDGEVEDYQVEIGEPEKWLQNPDLTDFGLDIDATFNLESPDPPMILADDFLCRTTGSITRIEIWGSWLYDNLPFDGDPGAVVFTLSIHEDIPADQSPTGYSMPGDVIWWKVYDPVEFMFEPFAFGLQEGWYNPATGYYEPLGDTQCWKYIFNLDEGEFIQEGTADEPKVYWLDIQAQPLDPDPLCRFGWKTSLDHWNDNGVWGVGSEPYLGPWEELIYPPLHPLAGQSIDLAFAIYGLENPYVLVDLTAFLEGPFTGSDMQPTLNGANLIPLNQPYSSDPLAKWYYTGTESVGSIPAADVVDWVMIELRDATSASNATGITMVDEKAAFIKKDGKIVATDGSSLMKFYVSFATNPYAVVWHRNHLGILSANPLNMVGLGLYRYDFTTSLGQAYLNGQKHLGGGIYGMMGGDGQPDGSVDNNDQINVWVPAAGTTGYKMGDYNMDTQVDNKDKNDVWYLNTGSGTQVPN